MIREKVSTGLPWEPIMGYSRAVRIGDVVEVSGTTALKDGEVIGEGEPYRQTIETLKIIEQSLQQAGAAMTDVIRTRVFVTDISQWEEIAKAHGTFFSDIRPAASLVEVKGLMNPKLLVEIEAAALVAD